MLCYIPLCHVMLYEICSEQNRTCYITYVMLCYITCAMLCYITYVMLCYITYVMLCYIKYVMHMSCYVI